RRSSAVSSTRNECTYRPCLPGARWSLGGNRPTSEAWLIPSERNQSSTACPGSRASSQSPAVDRNWSGAPARNTACWLGSPPPDEVGAPGRARRAQACRLGQPLEDHDPAPAVGLEVERELRPEVDHRQVGGGDDEPLGPLGDPGPQLAPAAEEPVARDQLHVR